MGNLHEQVPQMFAFAFLSLFPQPFISLFLGFIQKPILPFERIVNGIYLVVLIVELVLGFRAASNIIAIKTARFAVQYRDKHSGETGDAGGPESPTTASLYPSSGSPDRASSPMPFDTSSTSTRSPIPSSAYAAAANLPHNAQSIIPHAGSSTTNQYYRHRTNRSQEEAIELQTLRPRKEGRARSDSDMSHRSDENDTVDLGVTHISEGEVYSQLLFKERELQR
jgi:hypothetical protein